MFGIDDPYIWLAYVGSFACVIFSCIYAWLKRNESD